MTDNGIFSDEMGKTLQSGTLNILKIDLGKTTFAVMVENVKEVIPVLPVTKLFWVPPFVPGIVNIRGTIVTVVSLERLLGIREKELNRHKYMIILQHNELLAAIPVDEVDRILQLQVSDITIEQINADDQNILSEIADGVLSYENSVIQSKQVTQSDDSIAKNRQVATLLNAPRFFSCPQIIALRQQKNTQ